jgi:hypothetical protein
VGLRHRRHEPRQPRRQKQFIRIHRTILVTPTNQELTYMYCNNDANTSYETHRRGWCNSPHANSHTQTRTRRARKEDATLGFRAVVVKHLLACATNDDTDDGDDGIFMQSTTLRCLQNIGVSQRVKIPVQQTRQGSS